MPKAEPVLSSRRDLLKLAPASALVLAVGVPVAFAAPTEFERIYAEIIAIDKMHFVDDDALDEAADRQAALERHILSTPSQSLRDVLVKARLVRRQEIEGSVYDDSAQAGQYLIADLERLVATNS